MAGCIASPALKHSRLPLLAFLNPPFLTPPSGFLPQTVPSSFSLMACCTGTARWCTAQHTSKARRCKDNGAWYRTRAKHSGAWYLLHTSKAQWCMVPHTGTHLVRVYDRPICCRHCPPSLKDPVVLQGNSSGAGSAYAHASCG